MEKRGRDRLTSGIWARALEREDELARELIDEARRGARRRRRVGRQRARRRGRDHRRRPRGPARRALRASGSRPRCSRTSSTTTARRRAARRARRPRRRDRRGAARERVGDRPRVAAPGRRGDAVTPAAPEVTPAPEEKPPRATRRHHQGMAALTLGALGVVFGDIGTSPLYALQTVFATERDAVRPTEASVYGVISLVFWSITIDRLDQVRHVHHARRQRRRGRHHGADRADPAAALTEPPDAGRAGRARHLRRGAVLRRRDDHAGDLGAVGGRGPRGRRARRWSRSSSRSRSAILIAAVRRSSASAPARSAASSAR